MENPENKSKMQLIEEIKVLHKKVTELEKSKSNLKKSEEALKESEEQYRSLTNALPQFIYRLDKDLKYVSANKAYCKACFKSFNKIKGKTSNDLFPKDLADQYMTSDRKIIETGIMQEFTEKSRSIGGGNKWVHVIKLPVKDNKGNINGMIGIYWDITKRKKAEQELQEKMNELETFYRATLGREERVIELKQEVNELLEQLGKNKKYRDYSK
ncbi:MAG: PAS domain-containing protein [Bacteroidales bacterium]|nr:PAS domain-containing protein [Bacteroidales bacterium]